MLLIIARYTSRLMSRLHTLYTSVSRLDCTHYLTILVNTVIIYLCILATTYDLSQIALVRRMLVSGSCLPRFKYLKVRWQVLYQLIGRRHLPFLQPLQSTLRHSFPTDCMRAIVLASGLNV